MATTDKDRIAEHIEEAEVVFDDSMKGKAVDAITKPAGIDFKDHGKKFVPMGGKNMMCPGMKIPSKPYKEHYDEMEWMCDDCGEMHRKDVDCG